MELNLNVGGKMSEGKCRIVTNFFLPGDALMSTIYKERDNHYQVGYTPGSAHPSVVNWGKVL